MILLLMRKQNMISCEEFEALIQSFLSFVTEMDIEIKNQDGTLKNFTVNEMHCIDCIGKTENPNVTKLAKALNMTRGGISRLIKKLLNKGAVKIYTNKSNKKEIYYYLTPTGEEVFVAHERLHRMCHKQDANFLKQFSQEELAHGINFMRKYIAHTKQQIQK